MSILSRSHKRSKAFRVSHKRLTGILIAVLLLLIAGSALAQSREDDYLRREYGRYAFVFCPEDSAVIAPLWNSLRGHIPRVEHLLGIELTDTVSFVITPTEREWARVTAGAPLWANGIAFSQRGVAVLKSPSFGVKYGGPLPQTALHEYVHLLVQHDAPNIELPRWLNEGLAQVLANQVAYHDVALLARAVTSNRLHRLWQIEGLMGMNAQDARLGYAQSMIAVEFLRDRYGISSLANLVYELRGGKYIEEAFRDVYRFTLGEFESQLIADMQQTYGGSTLFTNTELWISILFVVLVLAAGLARWLHRRRKLREWEEEHTGRTSESSEPRAVPYTVNYTLVRRSREDEQGGEEGSDSTGVDDNPSDRPIPGN